MLLAVQVPNHPEAIVQARMRPRAHFTASSSVLVRPPSRPALRDQVSGSISEPTVLGSIADVVEEALKQGRKLSKGRAGAEFAKGLAAVAFVPGKTPHPIRSALALLTALLPDPFVTHRLSKEAVDYMFGEGLRHKPPQMPLLLRSPWILEVASPEHENLFGDTYNLAGYPVGGDMVLIGFCRPDTIRIALWRLPWITGTMVEDYGLLRELSTDLPDEATTEWMSYAAAFAIAFGTLIESEASIIQTQESDDNHEQRARAGEGRSFSRTRVRWVYLDGRYHSTNHKREPIGSNHHPAQNLDLTEGMVTVRAHKRQQVCGPGLKNRKEVEISRYQQKKKLKTGRQTKGVTVAGLEKTQSR